MGVDQNLPNKKKKRQMKIELNVSEVISIFKEIQQSPEKIFEMIRLDVREAVGRYLSEMMTTELTHFFGRDPYERKSDADNYRNGSYDRRYTLKSIGEVSVKVPRDRNGEFQTQVLPRSKQYETEIGRDLCLTFLGGVSTRTLSIMSQRLIGRKISHTEISEASRELIDSVERWRNRDLSNEPVKYFFIDGVNFEMRMGDSIEQVSVLVAIGVTEERHRLVVGLQAGDKESAPNWREFFKDLKRRGLDPEKITLGVMDGLPGLEKVFKEEFPRARVQRCQVHVARNVLAKVPQKFKQDVADGMRSIFYASSKSLFWNEFMTATIA
jgi:putative transposase